MKHKEFEKLVEDGIARIPEKFREKIKNVGIIVENEPTEKQLRENHIEPGWTLLGLYEGIPATERGEEYGVAPTLPDRIFIFQRPIEDEAGGDPENIREIVADTVWHEVAHYFGMDEGEVDEREARRHKNKDS